MLGGCIKAALCNYHVLPEIWTQAPWASADIFTTEPIEHDFCSYTGEKQNFDFEAVPPFYQ